MSRRTRSRLRPAVESVARSGNPPAERGIGALHRDIGHMRRALDALRVSREQTYALQGQRSEESAGGMLGDDRSDAVVPERDPVAALRLRRLLPRRVADDDSAALGRQDPVRPSFDTGPDPLLVDPDRVGM